MLKQILSVLLVLALVGCVDPPDSSSVPTGADAVDLGFDVTDPTPDAEVDMGADMNVEPDLSGCVCPEIASQAIVSCEPECEYECADGFNQCPGDELTCVDASTPDDFENGEDLNCDGLVGDPTDAVFVAIDGDDTNDGLTPQTPVRTLDEAFEVLDRQGHARLLVGSGDFLANIDIDTEFDIQGGWTVDDDGVWMPPSNTKTTIRGDDASLPTMSVRLRNSMQVSLSNLTLVGPNASANKDGQSVITLFIDGAETDADDAISFEEVEVVGGTAASGANGSDGTSGLVGGDGAEGLMPQTTMNVNIGGSGGVSPSCNARDLVDGGKGGDASRSSDGGTGSPGSDGSSSGPDGGEGGGGGDRITLVGVIAPGDIVEDNNGKEGQPGTRGRGGERGNSSQNLRFRVTFNQGIPSVENRPGDPGGAGTPGSGGGGGGAGGSTDATTAPSGGGGGAGGCPGDGGKAGQPGGASIAILVVDANVDLEQVYVTLGAGGSGGAGGEGGLGGCGGKGGDGPEAISLGDAGDGGEGGAGGSGAGGNGGNGGAVVGIYHTESSVIKEPLEDIPDTTRSSGGPGGSSPLSTSNPDCDPERGNDGESGSQGRILKIASF